MSELKDNKADVIICLNCGNECHDNFCPHCGQSTKVPPKLKMKNFGKGLIMSFGRLTPGFLTTAKGLMIHPWVVIRDHIHGKQIRYSPPFTMLIQVFLYVTIISVLIDGIFGTQIAIESGVADEPLFGYKGSNQLLNLLDHSLVIGTLFWGIPICFCIYLAFYRNGARKFNFAEYLTAFIYMFAAISIYDFIFSLIFFLIPGLNFDSTYLTWIICGIFSMIVLIKAFPQNKWWKYPLLFLWAAILIVIFTIAITLFVYRVTGYNLASE